MSYAQRFVYILADCSLTTSISFKHCVITAETEEDAYDKGAKRLLYSPPTKVGHFRNDYVVRLAESGKSEKEERQNGNG